MNPLPVSHKRLVNCTVQLSDATLANCTLLPLFDRWGVTAKVVLLSTRTHECRVVDWRPRLVYIPVLCRARVDVPWATPQRVTAGALLWFYDPRGLAEPYVRSMGGDLFAGDCLKLLPKRLAGMFWRRDLSRIVGVGLRSRGGVQFGRWRADWLSAATPRPTSWLTAASPEPRAQALPRPVQGWVLDPIWMRKLFLDG